MTRRLALLVALSSLAFGCEGSLSGPGTGAPDGVDGGPGGSIDAGLRMDGGVTPPGVDGGAPPGDGGSTADGGAIGPADAGAPPPFDAGPCGAALTEGVSQHEVAGVSAGNMLFGAATPDGGVVGAWRTATGVTIQRLSGGGLAIGSAIEVEGTGLYGLAASPEVIAVLVSRGSDALYFVGVSYAGEPRFEVLVLGEVDHTVTENEWFGSQIRYGRLTWTGEQFAAYYTVNRLWSDGIAHYGDQLRLFGPDGSAASMVWSWGCSHSMEVRIVHNGSRLGPVCASDCFPSKGIHFNHRTAELYTDEGRSDCRGRYGTSLGDVVPMDEGFWATFTATDDRASHDVAMVRIDGAGRAGEPIWLTENGHDERHVRAARYGAGFVVAWMGDGAQWLSRFDASGASLEGPVEVPAGLAASSDFFVLADGDVAWLTGGGALNLMRLRVCE